MQGQSLQSCTHVHYWSKKYCDRLDILEIMGI